MARAKSRICRESLNAFFEYDIHIDTRTIYMGTVSVTDDHEDTGVDAQLAERTIKSLLVLGANNKPINIIMNNIGGDWFHGMAIYDAIQACKAHITIKVLGQAMSMGSIILQAADRRLLYPNATIMVHDGYASSDLVNPKSLQAWAKNSSRLCANMYKIYAQRSGKSMKYWEKKCSNDYIMTAEQAVAEGLADGIVNG